MWTLIDQVETEMLNDDADREKQSVILLNEYESATEGEKKKMDAVLICVCGYSMQSLLDMLNK